MGADNSLNRSSSFVEDLHHLFEDASSSDLKNLLRTCWDLNH